MNTYNFRILFKSFASALTCVFLVNTIAFSDASDTTLSPPLWFGSPKNSAEFQATMICKLIEERAKKEPEKSIQEIYTTDVLLWEASNPPASSGVHTVLSDDGTEIFIHVPESNLKIRYFNFDPSKNNLLLPYTDWLRTKTHTVSKQIIGQIIYQENIVPFKSSPGNFGPFFDNGTTYPNKFIFILGPRGSGKTSLENKLLKKYPEKFIKLERIRTRAPQESEKTERSGVFMERKAFEEKCDLGEMCLECPTWQEPCVQEKLLSSAVTVLLTAWKDIFPILK